MADFATTGCAWCRQHWLGRNDGAVELMGISLTNQAEYVRCRHCGQLWEYPNGSYPHGVGAPDLPDDLPGQPPGGRFRG